jgi:6-phosphofructokinase 1
VPKTIDNDLDLPPHVDTFGFQTARHTARAREEPDGRRQDDVALVLHHRDGRKAGHLALGIGKAAGATLTLIPRSSAAPCSLKTWSTRSSAPSSSG